MRKSVGWVPVRACAVAKALEESWVVVLTPTPTSHNNTDGMADSWTCLIG